jgi:transcriptional regulator with XRE-family HTH domain
MEIGIAIRKLRKERNIKQGVLAANSGLTQTFISQIEKGHKQPSHAAIRDIASALDVPAICLYLLAFDEKEFPIDKRKKFNLLYPTVKSIIEQIIQ